MGIPRSEAGAGKLGRLLLALGLMMSVVSCGQDDKGPEAFSGLGSDGPGVNHADSRVDLGRTVVGERLVRLSDNLGYVETRHRLFLTVDGGEHFEDVTPPGMPADLPLGSVFVSSELLLRATMAPSEGSDRATVEVGRSADGGRTWGRATLSEDVGPLADAHFATDPRSNRAWAVLNFDHSPGVVGAALMFTSPDGGTSWEPLPDPVPDFDEIAFVSEAEGWGLSTDGPARLHRTIDGGRTWRLQDLAPPAAFARVVPGLPRMMPDGRLVLPGLARGQQGLGTISFMESTDDGTSWSSKATRPSPEVSVDIEGFGDMASMLSPAHWLMATQSSILETRDAGGTWEPVTPGPGVSRIFQLSFGSEAAGWLAFSRTECVDNSEADCSDAIGVLGTRDGGRTWQPVAVPSEL